MALSRPFKDTSDEDTIVSPNSKHWFTTSFLPLEEGAGKRCSVCVVSLVYTTPNATGPSPSGWPAVLAPVPESKDAAQVPRFRNTITPEGLRTNPGTPKNKTKSVSESKMQKPAKQNTVLGEQK